MEHYFQVSYLILEICLFLNILLQMSNFRGLKTTKTVLLLLTWDCKSKLWKWQPVLLFSASSLSPAHWQCVGGWEYKCEWDAGSAMMQQWRQTRMYNLHQACQVWREFRTVCYIKTPSPGVQARFPRKSKLNKALSLAPLQKNTQLSTAT